MKRNNCVAHIDQAVYWNGRFPFLHVRSTFSSSHPYSAHFHDCLSLGVLFKGETVLRRSGFTTEIGAGEMVLIEPMEAHSCNPRGDRERGYHMFYIDPEWVLRLLGAQTGSRLIAGKGPIGDAALFGALMRLARAVQDGRNDCSGCGALAEVIAANCTFSSGPQEAPSAVFSSWADGMNAAGGRAASVEESARELGLRRESFIRSFRRATGLTPLNYRQCLRLIRARNFLHRGHSLTETALACGYADQSHFHRMCVKYLSATPAQIKPRQSLSFKK